MTAGLRALHRYMGIGLLLASLALVNGWKGQARTDVGVQAGDTAVEHTFTRWAAPVLDSLDALSIETLRQRTYAAEIKVQQARTLVSATGTQQY